MPQPGGDGSQLPGLGGVFNPINLNAYHYAGLNPVKYVDPDGNATAETLSLGAKFLGGVVTAGEFVAASFKAAGIGIIFHSIETGKGADLYTPEEHKAMIKAHRQQNIVNSSDEVKVIGDDAKELPNQGSVSGGVEGAPPVDAGSQGKHVSGHKKEIKGRSKWKVGENGVRPTQEAWENRRPVDTGREGEVWEGVSNDGREIRGHSSKKGIHGYPK